MIKYIDLTGHKVGKLTVIRKLSSEGTGKSAKWLCNCICGNATIKQSKHLRSANAYSCGCVRRNSGPRKYMNGRPPEYYSWQAMKRRITNKKHKSYLYYRNIKVHPAWINSFTQFLKDMGPRPSKYHSIDRFPDRNGDYTPDNCRWATAIEQNNNKNNNHIITHGNLTMTTAEWARYKGLKYSTLKERLKKWTIEKSLNTKII